jgi:hypothetical protein
MSVRSTLTFIVNYTEIIKRVTLVTSTYLPSLILGIDLSRAYVI